MSSRFGPDNPEATFVAHDFPEARVDLGEIHMNYAVAGPADAQPLLLVPGQTESWWGYEAAMKLLAPDFRAYAVDLRGQGRSSRTPGRYSIDNWGNDLVRFIQLVIKRPTIVAGLSSGGVLTAWLSAYAPPGLVRAAYYEDPPLYASEVRPACGPSIRQSRIGNIFPLFSTFLGDQWSVGDWAGLVAAARSVLPKEVLAMGGFGDAPSQTMKEYDPEWARGFWSGTATVGCDHDRMLHGVKVPVLFTHHFRRVDEATGMLEGAIADLQINRVRTLIEGCGQPFIYRSLPQMGHAMHRIDPEGYVATLREWVAGLG